MKTKFVEELNFELLSILPIVPLGYDGDGDGGDGDGGDGDGGKPADTDDPAELKRQLSALNATNQKLKTEKQKIKEQSDKLKGISDIYEKLGGEEGVAKLTKYQEQLEKDEMLKLIADGKHDEYIERRTEGLKKSHENELAKRDEAFAAEKLRADNAEAALGKLHIDIHVREACRKSTGFQDSAIPDAIMLAGTLFSYDPEFEAPVMKDEEGGIIYGQDAKNPKTVVEWLAEIQEDKAHWWGETKGANIKGNKGKKGAELTLEEMLSQGLLDMDQYREEREKRKFKNFG